MRGNSHSCLMWNKFDGTNTLTSDLAFPSTVTSARAPQAVVTHRFGYQAGHCGALTHFEHPAFENRHQQQRAPSARAVSACGARSPHTPRLLVCQACSYFFTAGCMALDKKWPDFSELLSTLGSQQSLRGLRFEHFIFPPANYLLLSTAPALPLLVQYISPKYFCIVSTRVFWSFLKATERHAAMGRWNGYTTIFFLLIQMWQMRGWKPGAQGCNKGRGWGRRRWGGE